ncbi:MAG: hypothetical protein AAF483_18975, partial [Planctomycetota bacterium]
MKFLRPRFERLEQRQMLAADALAFDTSHLESMLAVGRHSTLIGEGEDSSAEGEDAADLVAFAQALGDAEVRFFCAHWAESCTDQRQLFEDGGKFLPFENISTADHRQNQLAIDENIVDV